MREIPLTQGKVALVDDDMYNFLMQWKWFYAPMRHNADRGYAVRNGETKLIYMHRVIMNAPDGIEVDHENGDGLNCQKYNLRFATHAQNAQNKRKAQGTRSQYLGVTWDQGKQRWRARVRQVFIGRYRTEIEAAKARDAKAKEMFGDFVRLNFPD